jgi:hypothetical protein
MSMTYTPAATKSDKLLTGYISVRAPELKHVYASIQEATSAEGVTNRFGRPTHGSVEAEHIEDTLRFLNTVDLVDSPSGDVRETVERVNDGQFSGLSFEPRLLYHLNQQEGRQSHFTEIYHALLSEGTRTVESDPGTIRTILKRETDYDFSWTDEKIKMWITLCKQLGLITKTEDELVVSPCRVLVYDAFVLAPTSEGDDPGYDGSFEDGEFYRAVNWINDHLFAIFEERTGTPRIHPAIADVLRNLERENIISLTAPGDAGNEVVIPPADLADDVRGNRRRVTHVSVSDRPDETAYEYPLDQFLTHS